MKFWYKKICNPLFCIVDNIWSILANDDAKIHYDEEDSKELVTIEINEIERQRKLINHENYEKRKELKNRENESSKVHGYVKK